MCLIRQLNSGHMNQSSYAYIINKRGGPLLCITKATLVQSAPRMRVKRKLHGKIGLTSNLVERERGRSVRRNQLDKDLQMGQRTITAGL